LDEAAHLVGVLRCRPSPARAVLNAVRQTLRTSLSAAQRTPLDGLTAPRSLSALSEEAIVLGLAESGTQGFG